MENKKIITRKDLLDEMNDVIKTTRYERNHITQNRARLSRGELEISKTVISANKNIVSAAIVAKGLIVDTTNGKED